MTSVELFAIALYEKGYLQGNEDEINVVLEQHKKLHELEIIKTHFNAQEFNGMMWHSAEEYYKNTFLKQKI